MFELWQYSEYNISQVSSSLCVNVVWQYSEYNIS